jgi:hypothetical protein
MWRWTFLALALTGCVIEGPEGEEELAIRSEDPGAVVGDPVSIDPGQPGSDDVGGEPGSNGSTNPGSATGAGGEGETAAPNGSPQVCYPGADASYTTCLPLVNATGVGAGYDYPSSSSAAYQAPLRFVDLDVVSPSLQLAPNFTLGELMQSYKGRYGLFQVHMIETLQAIRNQTSGPLVIHSGYRSPGYNAGVAGSATFSRHMYGDGADMHSEVVSLASLEASCQNASADYVSVYTTHVHCDWRYEPLDPAFYAASFAMSTTAASPPPSHEVSIEVDDQGRWIAEVTGFDEGEPYREWTAYDDEGERLEVLASATYRPPIAARTIEVMVGGRVMLQASVTAPEAWSELPVEAIEMRLDTIAAPFPDDHDHQGPEEVHR